MTHVGEPVELRPSGLSWPSPAVLCGEGASTWRLCFPSKRAAHLWGGVTRLPGEADAHSSARPPRSMQPPAAGPAHPVLTLGCTPGGFWGAHRHWDSPRVLAPLPGHPLAVPVGLPLNPKTSESTRFRAEEGAGETGLAWAQPQSWTPAQWSFCWQSVGFCWF